MISEILQKTFLEMDRQNIRYVVLRNYFPIEKLETKNDIDTFVLKDDMRKLHSLLVRIGWRKRFIPRKDLGHVEWFCFDVLKGKVFDFDIQTSLGSFALSLSPYTLLAKKRKHEMIFIPCEEHEKLLLALHQNEKQKSVMKSVIGKYRDRDIGRYLKQTIKRMASPILRILQPIQLITFIGVDGTGKGTMIEKLRQNSPVFQSTLYLGWKHYTIPHMQRLDAPGRFRYALFHLLLPWEFFFRFLKVKRNTKYGIMISDRFPLLKISSNNEKQKFSFGTILRSLDLVLSRFLLPKPFLLIYLTGNPQLLWERKKESNYKKFLYEYDRHKAAYEDFSGKKIIVDTTALSVYETFEKVRKQVFLALQQKL